MKVTIVNASPKTAGSASGEFGTELVKSLGDRTETRVLQWNRPVVESSQLEEVVGSDAVVFVFPLYVDGIPSHLLRILVELEGYMRGMQGAKPRVYAIVNCGFIEGRQNFLALQMMQHWCKRAGCVWGLGLGLGGGPMLSQLPTPPGKGPKKDMGAGWGTLVEAILNRGEGKDLFVKPNFPRSLYIAAAHRGWRVEAKRNNVSRRDLYSAPIAK